MNSKKHKISIITVVFNGIQTLEQTIESVVCQKYNNIEYIIIDGGSIDGTVDLIRKYDDQITYWVSEPDTGIYDAMNKGIDVATGDYIYFLGADDSLMSDDSIIEVSAYMNDEIDAIIGRVWSVDEKSKMQHIYGNNFESSIEDDRLNRNIKAHHQALFVRTSIVKMLKFDVQYTIGADYKFILQLWMNEQFTIKKIENIVAFFSNQGVSNLDISKRTKEHLNILEKLQFTPSDIKKFMVIDGELKMKKIFKCILIRIHLWDYLRKYNGWKIHKCSWRKCRWCKR